MSKFNFSDLDPASKRTVFWLADQVETATAFITDSVSHVGEIWEAAAFMKAYPKGSFPNAELAARLRLGNKCAETVLDCIARLAPGYSNLAERSDEELDELLADLGNAAIR